MKNKFPLLLFTLFFTTFSYGQFWYQDFFNDSLNNNLTSKEKILYIDSAFSSSDSFKINPVYGYKHFSRYLQHNTWELDDNYSIVPFENRVEALLLQESVFTDPVSFDAILSSDNCNPSQYSNWKYEGPKREVISSQNGYYGIGRINCIGGTESLLFAGTNSGLYKSNNQGVSWEKVPLRLLLDPTSTNVVYPPETPVLDIEISASGVIYASHGGVYMEIPSGHNFNLGVFRSEDQGHTWEYLAGIPSTVRTPGKINSSTFIQEIKAHPTNSDILVAFTSTELLITLDAGDSWQNIVLPYTDDRKLNDFDFDPTDPDKNWVISGREVFTTTNGLSSVINNISPIWNHITPNLQKNGYTGSENIITGSDFFNQGYLRLWNPNVYTETALDKWHNKILNPSNATTAVVYPPTNSTPVDMWTSRRRSSASGLNLKAGTQYTLVFNTYWDDYALPEGTSVQILLGNLDANNEPTDLTAIPNFTFQGPSALPSKQSQITIPSNHSEFDIILIRTTANSSYTGINPITVKSIELLEPLEIYLSSSWINTNGDLYVSHTSGNSSLKAKLELSTDFGGSFNDLNDPNNSLDFYLFGPQPEMLTIDGEPGNNPTIYLGGGGLSLAEIGTGSIPTYYNYDYSGDPELHADIRDIFVKNGIGYIASDGGVTKFTSPTNYNFINGEGLHASSTYNFDIRSETNEIVFANLDFGNFVRQKDQENWIDRGDPDGSDFIFGDGTEFDRATQIKSVGNIYDVNNSLTSVAAKDPLFRIPGEDYYRLPITRRVFEKNVNGKLYYSRGNKLYEYNPSNTPAHREILNTLSLDPNQRPQDYLCNIETYEISESDPKVAWCALRTHVYADVRNRTLWRCLDITQPTPIWEGVNPNLCFGGLIDNTNIFKYQPITDIEIDPYDDYTIYISLAISNATNPLDRSYVIKMTGADDPIINNIVFTDISDGWYVDTDGNTLKDDSYPFSIGTLKMLSGNGSVPELFAGTFNGMWYKKGSNDWVRYSKLIDDPNSIHDKPSLPPAKIWDIEVDNENAKIYCSIMGNGMWSAPLPCCPKLNSEWTPIDGDYIIGLSSILEEDLRILSGRTFTIQNSQIRIAPDVKITIENGGKLIIDNSTLTKRCDDLWEGIIVKGDPNIHHLANSSTNGHLEIKNGSKIMYAKNAITIGDPFSNPYTTSGGYFTVENCSFINNRISIHCYPYQFMHRGWIKNCKFLNNTDLSYDTYKNKGTKVGIKLWGTTGLPIRGCEFTNSTPNSSLTDIDGIFDDKGRGTAIRIMDADLSIYPLETYNVSTASNCTPPISTLSPSHIEGWDIGIDLFPISGPVMNTNNQMNIRNNSFTNNASSIKVDGYSKSIIFDNEINWDEDFKLNPTIDIVRGLHILNTDESQVFNNTISFANMIAFTNLENADIQEFRAIETDEMTGNNTGIIAHNIIESDATLSYTTKGHYFANDMEAVDLYCNTYTDLSHAWEYASSAHRATEFHLGIDPYNIFTPSSDPNFLYDPTNSGHQNHYPRHPTNGTIDENPYYQDNLAFFTLFPASQVETCPSGGLTFENVYCATSGSGNGNGNEGTRVADDRPDDRTNYQKGLSEFYSLDSIALHTSILEGKLTLCELQTLKFLYNELTQSKNFINNEGDCENNFQDYLNNVSSSHSDNNLATGIIKKPVFIVYPNPTNRSFTFSYDTKGQKGLNAVIFNKLGSIIGEISMSGIIGKTQVNTSNYASGIYYIQIKTTANKTIDYKKVVIIK